MATVGVRWVEFLPPIKLPNSDVDQKMSPGKKKKKKAMGRKWNERNVNFG